MGVVAAKGEIDVLDPAVYGALTITKAISIQGHGLAGLTVAIGKAPSTLMQPTRSACAACSSTASLWATTSATMWGGALDLSVDHRWPRRPTVGRGERTSRRSVSIHLAERLRRVTSGNGLPTAALSR